MANPAVLKAYSNMVADSTPEFYIEHLKRLRKNGIQPYFALAHVHNLQIVGAARPPGCLHGADERFLQHGGRRRGRLNPLTGWSWFAAHRMVPCGRNQTMFRYSWPLAAFMITLGQHTRAGIEENLWGTDYSRRITSVEMIEKNVRIARELGREIATARRRTSHSEDWDLVQHRSRRRSSISVCRQIAPRARRVF